MDSDAPDAAIRCGALRISRRRYAVYAAVTIALAFAAAFVFGDWVLYWIDRGRAAGGAARRARPRADEFERRIFEATPAGLRLRRLVDEQITDPISGIPTRFRTNALRFRGPEIAPKAGDELRILVLGDSITLAPYVDEAHTWPAQLERRLADSMSRSLHVINAAVSSAGLRDELLILNETGLLTQPDIVLVGVYLNDAKSSRSYPIPQGLAAYSEITRHWADMRFADAVAAEARGEYQRLSGRPSPTRTYAKEAWRTDRDAFEAEIAAAAMDWGAGFFSWAWDEMRPDLEIMRNLGRRFGYRLLVVLFPVTQQVEADFLDDRPQRLFEDLMAQLDLPRLDLLPVLRGEYQKSRVSLAYDQCHLRPNGNARVADAVAEFVRGDVAASSQR